VKIVFERREPTEDMVKAGYDPAKYSVVGIPLVLCDTCDKPIFSISESCSMNECGMVVVYADGSVRAFHKRSECDAGGWDGWMPIDTFIKSLHNRYCEDDNDDGE